MTVVINDVTVEPATTVRGGGRPTAAGAADPAGPALADIAERQLKRVADLQERVRAD